MIDFVLRLKKKHSLNFTVAKQCLRPRLRPHLNRLTRNFLRRCKYFHLMMVDENDDRPYCRAVNLNAATFQLSLPSCQADQNQEYIAIIIPQGTRQKPSQSTARKSTESMTPERKNCQDFGCQYEGNRTPIDDRWKTEYRCTIDECGKRVMKSNMRTKRTPIYPNCEQQLAPLLPHVSASDQPILNGQGRLEFRRLPASSVPSTTAQPQLRPTPQKREIMPRVESGPVVTTRRVPMPDQRTPSRTQNAPEILPSHENRISNKPEGQRPLRRCYVEDKPATTTKPTMSSPSTSRTTNRPLPRCY